MTALTVVYRTIETGCVLLSGECCTYTASCIPLYLMVQMKHFVAPPVIYKSNKELFYNKALLGSNVLSECSSSDSFLSLLSVGLFPLL